ncbi:MAG: hypothetical protein JWP37_3315 [Mucilaginibacter sp.]|nr:hypothetical protein [Mucilaginibacter sp.]
MKITAGNTAGGFFVKCFIVINKRVPQSYYKDAIWLVLAKNFCRCA